MAQEMMFDILLYLINNGKTSATKLASYFCVCKKTIYRNIDKLSVCGVPVYSIYGRNGGVDLLSTFKLDKCYLSTDERISLYSFVEEFPIPSYDRKMLKQKLIPEMQEDKNLLPPIIIDNSLWQSKKEIIHIPDNLLKHLLSKETIDIKYKNKTRTVSPYATILKSNNYYLAGFCHTKNDIRLFKIDRIDSLEKSSEPFVISNITRDGLIDKINSSFKEIEITIETSEKIDKILEEYNVKLCKTQGNKNILTIVARETSDLVFSLLKYEDRIKILSPKSLKDSIVNICKKVQNNYS